MRPTRRAAAAALALGMLVLPLAACAPEPDEQTSDEQTSDAPFDPEEKQEPEGGSWPEENPEEVFEKHQEIPGDFPAGFSIPEDAEIDDAGSRAAGTWFLVLRAKDADAADELWQEIIESGGFAVSDEFETSEGGVAATLASETLAVQAMTLPESDGSVLLSYDIAAL